MYIIWGVKGEVVDLHVPPQTYHFPSFSSIRLEGGIIIIIYYYLSNILYNFKII